MKQVKLLCVSALMLVASAANGQTFTHNGILYQARQDGAVKVVKVYNCENITIPDTVCAGNSSFVVSEIGSHSFYCLYNLRSVRLPKTLRRLCSDAFVNCMNLRKMVVAAQEPPLCDAEAFNMTDLSKVSLAVPDGCKEAYIKAEPWREAHEITEPSSRKDDSRKSKRTK